MASKRLWGAVLLAAIVIGGWLARSQIASAAGEVADVVGGWSTTLRDVAAAEPRTEVGLRSVTGESASVLVVVGRQEGDAAFALLAVGPDGEASVVVLPQDLLLAVPGFGEFRLVDALVFEGPDLAALSVTNQFGIRIDSVATVGQEELAGGLPAQMQLDLVSPFFEASADGVTRVLDAGPVSVDGPMIERLLTVAGAGDEFEWMQRQGAAWNAILAGVGADPGVADAVMGEGSAAADLLLTVAGNDDTKVATVPVTGAQSSMGVDALVPSSGQADDFVANRLDHLLLKPEGRPRVEILNGNGRIGTTATVASVLIRHGFKVIRTDNAENFDFAETLVVAQGDDAEQAAREITELLGRGLLFLEVRAPSGVVDVSIIVGKDIPSGEG